MGKGIDFTFRGNNDVCGGMMMCALFFKLQDEILKIFCSK